MRRRTFFGAALLLIIWPALAEDTRPGTELTYRFTFGENAKERLAAAVEVIRARLGDRATIETKGADSVVVRIPTTDKKRVATVKKLVTDPGHLEFRVTVEPDATESYEHYWKLFQRTKSPKIAPEALRGDDRARFPRGLLWIRLARPEAIAAERLGREADGALRPWMLVRLDAHDVTGESLTKIASARDETGLGKSHAVRFSVKKAHVPKMAALTRFEEDKYLAIVVNDRVHAAPLLRDTLSDRGVIAGNYTEDEAHALASVLASGELEDRPVLVNETKTPAKTGTEK